MVIRSWQDVMAMPSHPPRWMSYDGDPMETGIAIRCLSYIGECEDPPSSNRGPRIDKWNTNRGAPLASYWCASFAAEMRVDCGAETAGAGKDPSCDELLKWCMVTGRFSQSPRLGAWIFYGVPGDARHVGTVVRMKPYVCTVEGNAAWGGAFTTNGELVAIRRPDLTAKNVLGFGHVWPVGQVPVKEPVKPSTLEIP
jgi:hypothetical protein